MRQSYKRGGFYDAETITRVMRCLHDPANVQQTFSNRNAGRLPEICWTFAAICCNGAGRLMDCVNTILLQSTEPRYILRLNDQRS